jgi:hypothetical protein
MWIEFDEKAILDAVIRAKQWLNGSEKIGIDHRSEVAAVLAAIEILTKSNPNGKALPALPLTFGEWADRYDIKTHADRFLAIAVYVFEMTGSSTINKDVVQSYYKEARWIEPRNYFDVFGTTVEKRYLTKEKDGSQWSLTSTGYKHIQTLRAGKPEME